MAAAVVTVTLAVIAWLTLRPTDPGSPLPAYCVFCGQLGGLDFVLNTALFIPLGIGLRWLTGRAGMTVLIGVATTLAIEGLQWRFIPGRDASLGDLIANTVGTVVGVWLATEGVQLLTASQERVRRLCVLCGVAVALLIVASAALLRPIDPIGAQYVQWAPERPGMDLFRGRLVVVQLNGRLLRPREAFPSQWTYDSVTQTMDVRAVVRPPVPPSERQAIIITIANEEYEGFMLAQRGDAAVFRSTMGATRLKLRPILVGLEHALTLPPPTDPVLILRGSSNPQAIGLAREQRSGETGVTLRRTVGLAWAMLLPWDVALTSRWWPANALWLGLLVLPVTFLTMRSSHKPTVVQNPRFDWWPLGLVVVTLVAVPGLMGLSNLGPGEWLGVVTGLAVGVLLERAAPRSPSRVTSSTVVPTTHS